jgi:hypothetical protein
LPSPINLPMGVMTFHLPSPLPPGCREAIDRARFAGGYDHTPFPTAVRVEEGLLTLSRAQNESGFVLVPWPVADIGFPVSTSATLRERPEPYRLLAELARGKINQLRTQAAEWELLGLSLDADTTADLAAATRAFGQAALDPDAAAADAAAIDALARAYRASGRAARLYADTCLNIRKRHEDGLPTAWGCRLDRRPEPAAEPHALEAFNAVRLVPNWAAIEPNESRYDWATFDDLVDWAVGRGLRVSIGPLIDMGGGRLPAWLGDWNGELPSVAAFFCDFVETAVHRYRDRVTDWLLCSGFNHASTLGLTEDDRLRLAARLLDAARAADPEARWVVGLAQPWGDYLDRDEFTYSPLVFADTLLRSGLPVGGFELEVVAGDHPTASLLRGPMDTLRMLELFGVLGTPIELMFRHPGRQPGAPAPPADQTQLARTWRASDGEAAQAEWGEIVALLGLCLPHVRSVYWGQWADTPDDPSGLVTAAGRPKPLLDALKRLRIDILWRAAPPP